MRHGRIIALRRLISMLLVLLLTIVVGGSAAVAEVYPPGTNTRYAGMVKPQRGLADYTGQPVLGQYSTVWRGDYNGGGEGSGRHPGVDITQGDCQTTEVRVVAAGEIVAVVGDWQNQFPGRDPCGDNRGFGGWGNYVIVRHNNIPDREGYQGTAFSIYTHLYNVRPSAFVGDKVLRGTFIGYQGSTGNSSGSHLHFQMDRDKGDTPYAHPYWFGDPNSGDTPLVAEYTFNPMRFVQAHIVNTVFLGSGAWMQYYPNRYLTPPPDSEGYETEIDHEWFNAGPIGYATDNFSARWEGPVILSEGGWVFYVTVDDGTRLWIDNNLVVDEWHQQTPTTYEGRVLFSSVGQHTIKLEYFDATGVAVAQLAWHKVPKVYIPVVLKDYQQ